MSPSIQKLLVSLIAAAALAATGCVLAPRQVVQAPPPCDPSAASEASTLVRAGHAHFTQGDYASATGLYLRAAELSEGRDGACPATADARRCTPWLSAAESAIVGRLASELGTAVDGYTRCLGGVPYALPTNEDRVVINIGAAMAGRPAPYGLPGDAHLLRATIERARQSGDAPPGGSAAAVSPQAYAHTLAP